MPLVKVGWLTVVNDMLQVRSILSKKSPTTSTGSNPTKVSLNILFLVPSYIVCQKAIKQSSRDYHSTSRRNYRVN